VTVAMHCNLDISQ